MPRLPIPSDTDAFPKETREAMRHIHATRTTVPPPSSYLTHAGKAGALLSDLVEHMRYHTTLTQEETELAVCTAVRAADVDYIWGAHVRLGLAAGAREEAINAIDTFAPLDDLTPDEALIIGYGRELLEDKHVTDATFAAVQARFGRERADGADGVDERLHDERHHPARGRSSSRSGYPAPDTASEGVTAAALIPPGGSPAGRYGRGAAPARSCPVIPSTGTGWPGRSAPAGRLPWPPHRGAPGHRPA